MPNFCFAFYVSRTEIPAYLQPCYVVIVPPGGASAPQTQKGIGLQLRRRLGSEDGERSTETAVRRAFCYYVI